MARHEARPRQIQATSHPQPGLACFIVRSLTGPLIPQKLRQQFLTLQSSIPICLDDCSTTDQTAQSLRLSPTLPPFETDRSNRRSSMPAAIIQVFFRWYNTVHRHSGIAMPGSIHPSRKS